MATSHTYWRNEDHFRDTMKHLLEELRIRCHTFWKFLQWGKNMRNDTGLDSNIPYQVPCRENVFWDKVYTFLHQEGLKVVGFPFSLSCFILYLCNDSGGWWYIVQVFYTSKIYLFFGWEGYMTLICLSVLEEEAMC